MGKHADAHRRSVSDPTGFWADSASAIDWYESPSTILDDSDPRFPRWSPDGVLNTCYNALDRHADGGRAEQPALIYDSPVTGSVRAHSYAELRDEVARFSGVLSELGVSKGDTVVIYMPMVPEAVAAMLACSRLGATHSVVFGGFAPHELAVRIDDARPKVMVSASCGIEGQRVIDYQPLIDKAIKLATHKPQRCIIVQREQSPADLKDGRYIDYYEAVRSASAVDCVPVESTHPLYILYTSGTTAMPKGVQRDNGGHAVALRWSLENVYDIGPGDVFWTASDVGWVVGHSYIVYAPLLTGATSILYEGKPVGTPDAGAFWRVASQHGVKALFTAPTAFRAIKKEDPNGKHFENYDLSRLKYLFLAGERLDPDTYYWASDLLGVPVVDHWWQTETGWPIAANCMGLEHLPIKAGSPTKPVPGYEVRILDHQGHEAAPNQEGAVALKLPLPPGCLTTLWHNDDRFISSYLTTHDGYYATGDGGHFDEDGYLYVMGRMDDVINVAGHRLSTGAIEEVLSQTPQVAECAVIGVHDAIKGQIPVGLVVLKAGAERSPDLERELVAAVRDEIGPVASFKKVHVVDRLPKTRSGKILRSTMRSIAEGHDYRVPSTIDDPAILDEIGLVLKSDAT
jgi:propionyl-CoA synthetase